jgi:hypothetical protein
LSIGRNKDFLPSYRCIFDSRDNGRGLCPGSADTNDPAFASDSLVANIDIVAPAGQIKTDVVTNADVVRTSRGKERLVTKGAILGALRIASLGDPVSPFVEMLWGKFA